MYQLVAQGIGILAMIFNIVSYQGKKQSTVIALQLMGGLLFAISFLMLGEMIGGILNVIATLRALIFLFKDKLKADRLPWFIFFIATSIAVYVLNFTLFGKEPTVINLLIEVLPVIGMIALNVGFRLKKASDVRKCALVSSPAWLIYNISAGAVGAIICEVVSLVSIFVGMFRHDRKNSEE